MQQQPDSRMVPLDQIVVLEGYNPRTYFEPVALEELVESIRTDGVLSAITVRPAGEDRYELICGERRFRASRKAGLGEIPAVIRDVDDVTARRMRLVENIRRSDLSVPDEAMAARAIVDDCEGDREVAARTLGWNQEKLAHRLLLLHATQPVLDALTRKQINPGHAELLATIPAQKQDAALPKIIENKLTVQQVREQVLGITLPLTKAKFNTAGCAGCPHNSDVQASLFESNVGAGRCSNRACFNEKTQEWVELRKTELKEEFGSIALLTEKEPGTTTPLLATGDMGVGQTQLAACKGCAYYGAILDNRIGPTLGAIQAPTCFQVACNKEKRAAYQESLTPEPAAVDEPASAGNDAPAAESASASPARKKTAKKPAKAKKATVRATSASVVGHYDRAVRDTVTEQIGSGAVEPILALAVYGMATITANAAGTTVGDVLSGLGVKEKHAYKHTGTLLALSGKEKSELQDLLQQAAINFFTHRPDHSPSRDEKVSRKQLAASLVAAKSWNVQPHVRVDREFLQDHTKASLEGLLTESGFQEAYQAASEDGPKKFKALLSKGKNDFVEGIVGFNFDFSSYTPQAMLDHMKSLQDIARNG